MLFDFAFCLKFWLHSLMLLVTKPLADRRRVQHPQRAWLSRRPPHGSCEAEQCKLKTQVCSAQVSNTFLSVTMEMLSQSRSSIPIWIQSLRLMDKILQVPTDNLLKREVSSEESRLEMLPPAPPTSMLTLSRGDSSNLQDFVHSEGGSGHAC